MNEKQKLILQELSLKIMATYDQVSNSYRGYELDRKLMNWRIDVYECIDADLKEQEELDYVLNYLQNNAPLSIFLEVNNIACSVHQDQNKKVNKIYSIINSVRNFLRIKKNAKEICVDNSISIGRSCDANGNPRLN